MTSQPLSIVDLFNIYSQLGQGRRADRALDLQQLAGDRSFEQRLNEFELQKADSESANKSRDRFAAVQEGQLQLAEKSGQRQDRALERQDRLDQQSSTASEYANLLLALQTLPQLSYQQKPTIFDSLGQLFPNQSGLINAFRPQDPKSLEDLFGDKLLQTINKY